MIWLVVFLSVCSLTCIGLKQQDALRGWPPTIPPNFRQIRPAPGSNLPPFHIPSLQSPINIQSILATQAILPDLQFEDLLSNEVLITMRNTGHTVEFVLADETTKIPRLVGGPLINIGEFAFKNLHVHWGAIDVLGAEHKLNSRRYAIEGHCVHYNLKYKTFEEAVKHSDGLAVVAFFGQAEKTDNPKLDKIIRLLPNVTFADTTVTLTASEILGWFADLGEPTNYFTYPGSLTTAPYTENVVWIVYPKTLHLSSRQVKAFRKLLTKDLKKLKENIRPIQPFNNRPLIYTV